MKEKSTKMEKSKMASETEYSSYLSSIRQLFDDAYAVMAAKAADYTNGGDPLSNFYDASKKAGITPMQAWFVHFHKHVTAIEKFVRDGFVESEPIVGRIHDAINYLAILPEIIKREGEIPAKKEVTNG